MNNGQTLQLRFGQRVREIAMRLGLSIEDLSKQTSWPLTRLWQILDADSACVTLHEMVTLAGIIRTPLADLLDPGSTIKIITLEKVE